MLLCRLRPDACGLTTSQGSLRLSIKVEIALAVAGGRVCDADDYLCRFTNKSIKTLYARASAPTWWV